MLIFARVWNWVCAGYLNVHQQDAKCNLEALELLIDRSIFPSFPFSLGLVPRFQSLDSKRKRVHSVPYERHMQHWKQGKTKIRTKLYLIRSSSWLSLHFIGSISEWRSLRRMERRHLILKGDP